MNHSTKFTLIFIFILFGCDNKSNHIDIVGKWQNIEDVYGSYFEYREDSTHVNIIKDVLPNGKPLYIDLAKGLIQNHDTAFHYRMKQQDDGAMLYTYLVDKNKKYKLRTADHVKKADNLLVLTGFKIYKGKIIKDHIDEVCAIKRIDKQEKTTIPKKTVSNSIITIPDNYSGLFFIVYSNSKTNEEYDGINRIYRIPELGVLNTKFKARTVDRALNREIFYRNSGKNKIPTISSNEYIRLKQNKKTLGSYYMDSVYAYTKGYNQLEGEARYKQICEKFDGNIEQFCIDTLKNIVSQSVRRYMDKRLEYLESF